MGTGVQEIHISADNLDIAIADSKKVFFFFFVYLMQLSSTNMMD